jgi:glyoxylase-like metal-dependent hydrolase (beta-lactamase superfamily II)
VSETRFTIINIGCLSMNKFWGETERKRQASATCTLLETGGKRLIVDPSPGPEQLSALLLATTGLSPRDIDIVFVTHFHGDHLYGLELFDKKPWLMAKAAIAEWKDNVPQDNPVWSRFEPAEDRLPQGVSLVAAPGHTAGLHCLHVNTAWGKLVVAGDAVMTKDFFDAEDGFHNSVDFSQVKQTIRIIREVADLVIPGHGNYFINRKSAEQPGR